MNEASESPVKLSPTFLIFTMGAFTFISTKNLLTTFEYRRPIEETFTCCDFADYKNRRQN